MGTAVLNAIVPDMAAAMMTPSKPHEDYGYDSCHTSDADNDEPTSGLDADGDTGKKKPSRSLRPRKSPKQYVEDDCEQSAVPTTNRRKKSTSARKASKSAKKDKLLKTTTSSTTTASSLLSTSMEEVPSLPIGDECEWSDSLLVLGTKELNEILKKGTWTLAQIQTLKAARRRAKNRTYALRSRQKKSGKDQTPCPGPTLEEEARRRELEMAAAGANNNNNNNTPGCKQEQPELTSPQHNNTTPTGKQTSPTSATPSPTNKHNNNNNNNVDMVKTEAPDDRVLMGNTHMHPTTPTTPHTNHTHSSSSNNHLHLGVHPKLEAVEMDMLNDEAYYLLSDDFLSEEDLELYSSSTDTTTEYDSMDSLEFSALNIGYNSDGSAHSSNSSSSNNNSNSNNSNLSNSLPDSGMGSMPTDNNTTDSDAIVPDEPQGMLTMELESLMGELRHNYAEAHTRLDQLSSSLDVPPTQPAILPRGRRSRSSTPTPGDTHGLQYLPTALQAEIHDSGLISDLRSGFTSLHTKIDTWTREVNNLELLPSPPVLPSSSVAAFSFNDTPSAMDIEISADSARARSLSLGGNSYDYFSAALLGLK